MDGCPRKFCTNYQVALGYLTPSPHKHIPVGITRRELLKMKMHSFSSLVWYDEMKQREALGRVYMIVFMYVCAVL